jgi:hypothetical protein
MGDTPVRLGSRWRLWDQFSLRGPGFPADGVLRLAPDGLALAADRFGPAEKLAGAEWNAFEETFDAAAVKTALVMQHIAAVPGFRAAIAWQNRAILDRGIGLFLAWDPSKGRTSQPRQREELVAHYWQRFCVKNDTIGFFGPVGWGTWDLGLRGLRVDPGDGLVAETDVYFSSWAIDTLAKTIGADPALREWIAPRRVPFVRTDGGTVSLPGRPPQEITPDQARLLDLCDGTRPARDLGHPEVLAELAKHRWIVWQLEVPADARPERYLRSWLDRVGDAAARQRGLDQLDVLERGRARIRATADPDEISDAMAELESEFMALTETAAAREKSDTTAPCRALAYSDCRRSATVRLGADVLSAMAPLELLLTSASWLTAALADRVMSRARKVFDELGPVDLATFWFACMPILHGDATTDATELQNSFWQRWNSVLDLPAGATAVRLSTEDLSARVRAAFAPQGSAWPAARYLSPDIMIAAVDEEAVRRGDFELVLGELHVAMNTLGASLYVNQHPAPAELFEQTDLDHPHPRLMPLLPKEHKSRLSARIRHSLVRPEDYHVALVDFTADPNRPRTVLSADVQVRLAGERLVAVLPDGAEFDVIDVFSHVLTTLVVDRFKILPETAHSPRVTIDKMVVARETWRFGPPDLAFADEKTEARRFVRARHWQARHDLPRFVFVTSPAEPRPLFVDFDSPMYVNLFTKAARRMARKDPEARLTITEMLPTPEQTWLTDDEGNKYTSELRFVAVAD